MKHKVCVYCSSSGALAEKFYEDARELGTLLGQNNMDLVYGGSNVGTMYETAKTAKKSGSKIYGVMPEKLYAFGVSSNECDEFYLTKEMRERKAKLDELSDSIVAMAGGFGTLEEVAEMLVQKQLGYNNKPIVFLNTNGFYNNLIAFFEDIVVGSFAKDTARNLYFVADTPQEVIDYLLKYNYKQIELSKEDIYSKVPVGKNG